METSFESQLDDFEVETFHIAEPAGSYDMLQVRCPRLGCKAEFWVRRTWGIIRPVEGRPDDPPAYPVGRNCPDCGKVSRIPEAFRIRFEPPIKNKRRIVRRRRKS